MSSFCGIKNPKCPGENYRCRFFVYQGGLENYKGDVIHHIEVTRLDGCNEPAERILEELVPFSMFIEKDKYEEYMYDKLNYATEW